MPGSLHFQGSADRKPWVGSTRELCEHLRRQRVQRPGPAALTRHHDNTGHPRRPSGISGLAPAVETEPEPLPQGREPSVGDRVMVGALGLEGIISAIHDTSAEVDVRGKRMRANIRELRLVGGPVPAARVSVHVDLQPRENVSADLNVIGCTVDEALARAERFLDQSLLTDQRVVRVIQGYGTGQLKRALTGFLEQHPLVARLETAPPEHGGGGVTVVELKE